MKRKQNGSCFFFVKKKRTKLNQKKTETNEIVKICSNVQYVRNLWHKLYNKMFMSVHNVVVDYREQYCLGQDLIQEIVWYF
jgi:hypothetical protein